MSEQSDRERRQEERLRDLIENHPPVAHDLRPWLTRTEDALAWIFTRTIVVVIYVFIAAALASGVYLLVDAVVA